MQKFYSSQLEELTPIPLQLIYLFFQYNLSSDYNPIMFITVINLLSSWASIPPVSRMIRPCACSVYFRCLQNNHIRIPYHLYCYLITGLSDLFLCLYAWTYQHLRVETSTELKIEYPLIFLRVFLYCLASSWI